MRRIPRVRVHKILHKSPRLYDWVQALAGKRFSERRLAAQTPYLPEGYVCDVGGGTGIWRDIWSSDCQYVCLDIDMNKLRRFSTHQQGVAVRADAVQMSLKNRSVDVIVCIGVAHHFATEDFDRLLHESVRVLKPEGMFLFLDPVWSPNKILGRLMWRYDQGSYPRTTDQLREMISQYYQLLYEEEYTIYHTYFLCRGVKRSDARMMTEVL